MSEYSARLDGLYQALSMLSEASADSEKWQTMLEEIAKWMDADRGMLIALGKQTENWEYLASLPERPDPEQVGESHAIYWFMRSAMENGKGVMMADGQVEPALDSPLARDELVELPQSCICAPLLWNRNPIGAIYLARFDRHEAFSRDDLLTLEIYGLQAASILVGDQRQKAIEEVLQDKAKFISVVTHELRIPMTSIKGYADLLRQGAVGPINEQQTSFLNVIRNNVERMSSLISNLSDLSKLQTDRLKLDLAEIAIDHLIDQTVAPLKAQIEGKQHDFQLNVFPDLPAIHADAARVRQVLLSLVDNAIRYTPDGGEIQITAYQDGPFVKVDVKDNGIGIAQEDLNQVFEPFFRSEDAAVREQQGWGLALAVAVRMVAIMGGNIGVESVAGQGSTFWLTLPLSAEPGGDG